MTGASCMCSACHSTASHMRRRCSLSWCGNSLRGVAFGGGVLDARPSIQLADPATLLGIADDDPAGALHVASRRREVGGLDQPSHHGVGHGIGPQPAHGAARRHHLEQIGVRMLDR